MIDIQAVYAGPMIHKTEKFNPTEVLVRLIDENPGASRDVVERLFIAEIEEDRDYRTPVLKYFFFNAWMGLHPERRQKSRERNMLQKAELKQAAAENIQRIKRAVIISELMMPNNKKVADCTGIEMAKFGKFGAKIGKLVQRRKVGAVLSEQQLWKMYQDCR